jgi:hypothetical protein
MTNKTREYCEYKDVVKGDDDELLLSTLIFQNYFDYGEKFDEVSSLLLLSLITILLVLALLYQNCSNLKSSRIRG